MYIHAKVLTGAREEKISLVSENHFKVSVREKAERNLANRRVIEVLAAYFKVPARKVRLISGHHTPSKIFSLDVEETA